MLVLVDIDKDLYHRITNRHNATLDDARTLISCLFKSIPLPNGICGVIANGEPLPDDVKKVEYNEEG